MNDFNSVLGIQHSIENFEPVTLHNLRVDAAYACSLSSIRVGAYG